MIAGVNHIQGGGKACELMGVSKRMVDPQNR